MTIRVDRQADRQVDPRVDSRAEGATAPNRAVGAASATIHARGLASLSETGGFRMKFVRAQDRTEAVIVNVAGAMAGGDRARFEFVAKPGARAVATTATAEKVHRREGAPTLIDVALSAGAGARLHWLPQETILFEAAALERRLDVDVAADGEVVALDIAIFGRIARGERAASASLRDRWRVRREGKLVYADEFSLPKGRLLERPAIGGGARALANVLLVASDAAARLDAVRSALAAHPACEAGASAFDGLLAIRASAASPAELRAAIVAVAAALGAPVPRSWA